jgi:hypothetical protein
VYACTCYDTFQRVRIYIQRDDIIPLGHRERYTYVSKALRFPLLPTELAEMDSNRAKKLQQQAQDEIKHMDMMQLAADAGYYLSNIYDRVTVGGVYRTALGVLEAKMQQLYDTHQYRLYSAVSELHKSLSKESFKLSEGEKTIKTSRSDWVLNHWYAEHVETGDANHYELEEVSTLLVLPLLLLRYCHCYSQCYCYCYRYY